MKIVIIGGVAGGASAATRARRVNPKAEILIFEKGHNVSFANCGLPYHLGGEIPSREKLIVAKKELFENRFGIKIYTRYLVTKINPSNKTITVTNLESNASEDHCFDKLIISTGSKLREIPAFKNKFDNVFSLWSLENLDNVMDYLKKNPVHNAIVIGAGFVGLEVAEQLKHKGLNVTLIEKATQVLGPLDPEMAKIVEKELLSNKISLKLGKEIVETKLEKLKVKEVTLDSSEIIPTDLILWGIGVLPENSLAVDAGLEIGAQGGIKVNENQQTSNPDIYAVGDASEYFHQILDKKVLMPLAGPANRAGRIAGEHAARNKNQFSQKVIGTSIVRIFSKNAALCGLSEKICKLNNIKYSTSYISANNHAGYFPGAKEMIIKILFNEDDGKILGAQIVGEEGVDKRIDIISSIVHFNGTAKDLALLDLAYAPPFGSAKDPVHISAYTILNHLDKSPLLLHPSTNLAEFQVIDTRTEKELKELPLENALHIPVDTPINVILERIKNLDKSKPVVVACHSGKRAHILASSLANLGFSKVYNLTGGMMVRSLFNKVQIS